MLPKLLPFLALIVFLSFPQAVLAIEKGVQVPDANAANRASVTENGFGWIKYQYAPGDTGIVQKAQFAKSRGMKVMISVAKNHDNIKIVDTDEGLGCSGGYGQYRQFIQKTVTDLGANIDAIEIGNEPNLAGEWDSANWGLYSIEKYGWMLWCGASGAKAANPNVAVISAGFSPGGISNQNSSIQQLVGLQNLTQVDYIGAHIYVPQNSGPSTAGNSFNDLTAVNQIASAAGKKVWVTEFGWQRCSAGISGSQQLNYIDQAYQVAGDNTEGMIIWNFGFGTATNPGAEGQEFECYNIEAATTKGTTPLGTIPNIPGTPPVNRNQYGIQAGAQEQPYFQLNGNAITYIPKAAGENCVPGVGSGAGNGLQAPSLGNDAAQIQAQNQALLPTEITASGSSNTTSKTGIQRSFLDQVRSLLCGILPGLCLTDVNLPGGTSNLANNFESYGRSQYPTDIQLKPATNDCNLVDTTENGQAQTGNQDLNKVSAFSTSGTQLPSFDDIEAKVQECLKNQSITIDGRRSVQDERLCRQNIESDLQKRSWFPEGITPFPEK